MHFDTKNRHQKPYRSPVMVPIQFLTHVSCVLMNNIHDRPARLCRRMSRCLLMTSHLNTWRCPESNMATLWRHHRTTQAPPTTVTCYHVTFRRHTAGPEPSISYYFLSRREVRCTRRPCCLYQQLTDQWVSSVQMEWNVLLAGDRTNASASCQPSALARRLYKTQDALTDCCSADAVISWCSTTDDASSWKQHRICHGRTLCLKKRTNFETV